MCSLKSSKEPMSNETSNIQNLLRLVEEINKRYVSVRKAKEENGSSYNIFDVLGLTNDEVGLHSTFIASLLSPDRHGAGRRFLKAFLKLPALNIPEGLMDINAVQVQRELYIGPKTDTTGGRIDLFISDASWLAVSYTSITSFLPNNLKFRHNYYFF